jgi:hypothetical protein
LSGGERADPAGVGLRCRPGHRPFGEDEVGIHAPIDDVACHPRQKGVGVAGEAALATERVIHRHLAGLGEYSLACSMMTRLFMAASNRGAFPDAVDVGVSVRATASTTADAARGQSASRPRTQWPARRRGTSATASTTASVTV